MTEDLISPWTIALNAIYEVYKALHKTNAEKFEEEWKHDAPIYLKALQDGDADTINRLDNKYRLLLL